MYVYRDAAFCTLEPRASVACTCTDPPAGGLDGVTNVNDCGVRLLMTIADPLKVAVVSLPKSSPLTVTVCPPATGPDAGASEVIVGAARVSSLMRVFQQFGPVHAPS